MSKPYVIEIDTREQNPLIFPRSMVWSPAPHKRVLVEVKTKKVKLDAGDYRLACDHSCVVERKMGLAELAHNLLTSDRVRFSIAWARLMDVRHPILLVEQALHDTRLDHCPPTIHEADVWCSVLRLARAWNVPTFFTPQARTPKTRMALGTQVMRILLTYTNPLPVDDDPFLKMAGQCILKNNY